LFCSLSSHLPNALRSSAWFCSLLLSPLSTI
jgi:hypothetical protein